MKWIWAEKCWYPYSSQLVFFGIYLNETITQKKKKKKLLIANQETK